MSIFSDLERDEGYRLEPYLDTEDHWTIGVGHNIETGIDPEVLVIMAIKGLIRFDDETARLQLAKDIRNAETICKSIFGRWEQLTQTRKDVLLNMAFNLGFNRISKFVHLIDAVEKADWSRAAEEMLNSKWALQVKGRAKRLAHAMRGDDA